MRSIKRNLNPEIDWSALPEPDFDKFLTQHVRPSGLDVTCAQLKKAWVVGSIFRDDKTKLLMDLRLRGKSFCLFFQNVSRHDSSPVKVGHEMNNIENCRCD